MGADPDPDEPPSERTFLPTVGDSLRRVFGAEHVIREPRLPSGREPDFLVTCYPLRLAVEVENRAEDTIHGAGQALLYAGETDALPAVIFPANSGEDEVAAELEALRQFLPVRALPRDGL